MSIHRDRYEGRRGGLEPRAAGMQRTHLETEVERVLNRDPQQEHDVDALVDATSSTSQEVITALVKLRARGAAIKGSSGWKAGQR